MEINVDKHITGFTLPPWWHQCSTCPCYGSNKLKCDYNTCI